LEFIVFVDSRMDRRLNLKASPRLRSGGRAEPGEIKPRWLRAQDHFRLDIEASAARVPHFARIEQQSRGAGIISSNVLEGRNAVEPWRRRLVGTAIEYATLAATTAAHDNPTETGKLVAEPVPDPAADVFQRRHFQTRNLIQVMVVEFGAQFGDQLPDLVKIAHPIRLLVGLAPENDLNLERVTVEPRITVPVTNVHRQVVGGLERKFPKYLEHLHTLGLDYEAILQCSN
jgi:hypothetical protein